MNLPQRSDHRGNALTLWGEFSALKTLQESAPVLEEELQRTLLAFFHETNPSKREELLEGRRRIREKQEFIGHALQKAEQLAQQIQEHHNLFCAGRHPREGALLAVARARSLSKEVLRSDLQKFGEILLKREALERAESQLEEQRAVFGPYMQFRSGKHRRQKAIEELAKLERIRFEVLDTEDAVEAFGRLARDGRLPIIARVLRAQSAEARFAQERAILKKKLADERIIQEEQRSDLSALRSEKAECEQHIRELEERLADLEGSEHRRLRRREEDRAEILLKVRSIREWESTRARQGGSFEYDPIHGYLMAESWRLLRRDLEAGVWHQGRESDHYFFLTL